MVPLQNTVFGSKYIANHYKIFISCVCRKRQHDMFIAREQAEFEMGRQHLANMMGMDPHNMTQAHGTTLENIPPISVVDSVPDPSGFFADPDPDFPDQIRIFGRSGSGLRKKVRSGSGKKVRIRNTGCGDGWLRRKCLHK